MVDCDDEKKLQKFYGELLGWEMCELFARPAVRSSSGIVFLFIEEKDYVPPVWPEKIGKQQNRCILIFRLIMFWKQLGKQKYWEQRKRKINLEEKIL